MVTSAKKILTVKVNLLKLFFAHISVNAFKSEIKIIDVSSNSNK